MPATTKLNIGIVELLDRGPNRSVYGRIMRANLSSIMPQVLAVWCEEAGHQVHVAYYNGPEPLAGTLPRDLDMLFIGSFTQSAHVAYALSSLYRSRGAITVLGGPHARSYPRDACRHFDYVFGFTTRELLGEILKDRAANRTQGVFVSAPRQPRELPGVRQRWKFIAPLLDQAPWLKMVAMIGSMGCPYRCGFCIDADVPYQPLDYESLKDDLRFLLTKFKKPIVGWHDPNFGFRFDDYMTLIEEAAPPGAVRFIAESSLSTLPEENVKRLARNGFVAVLPGIESWYETSRKTGSGRLVGMEKVKNVAEQVNMIHRHIPYIQANFVMGLDCDEGDQPFDCTKEFLDLAPATLPGFSLSTSFGQAAPLNREYQEQGRVIGFPYHFLDNTGVMNVVPKHYGWTEFYDRLIDVHEHAFRGTLIRRRFLANRGMVPRLVNLLRGLTFEGWGKVAYFRRIRRLLDEDAAFRGFFEQETREVPEYFVSQVKRDLGPLWEWLPDKSLYCLPEEPLQPVDCG